MARIDIIRHTMLSDGRWEMSGSLFPEVVERVKPLLSRDEVVAAIDRAVRDCGANGHGIGFAVIPVPPCVYGGAGHLMEYYTVEAEADEGR